MAVEVKLDGLDGGKIEKFIQVVTGHSTHPQLRKTIEDIMDAATRQAFVSPVGPGDFLKPAGPAKDFRWILSERKKDWLGIDAVLYENGVAVLAIDLKTGCP